MDAACRQSHEKLTTLIAISGAKARKSWRADVDGPLDDLPGLGPVEELERLLGHVLERSCGVVLEVVGQPIEGRPVGVGPGPPHHGEAEQGPEVGARAAPGHQRPSMAPCVTAEVACKGDRAATSDTPTFAAADQSPDRRRPGPAAIRMICGRAGADRSHRAARTASRARVPPRPPRSHAGPTGARPATMARSAGARTRRRHRSGARPRPVLRGRGVRPRRRRPRAGQPAAAEGDRRAPADRLLQAVLRAVRRPARHHRHLGRARLRGRAGRGRAAARLAVAGWRVAIALVLATVFQMVVGELVPKGVAIARPEPPPSRSAGGGGLLEGVRSGGPAVQRRRRLDHPAPRRRAGRGLVSVRSFDGARVPHPVVGGGGTLNPEAYSVLRRACASGPRRLPARWCPVDVAG